MRDYMLRAELAAAARSEKLCTCGHMSLEHREQPYGSPEYQPLRFVCHADGCTCDCYRDQKC